MLTPFKSFVMNQSGCKQKCRAIVPDMQSGVRLGDLIVVKADALDSDQLTGMDTHSHVVVPSGCMQPSKETCHVPCNSGRCCLTSSRFTLPAKHHSPIQTIYIFSLYDSSGESTHNTWEVNKHQALQASDNRAPKKQQQLHDPVYPAHILQNLSDIS